jgi:hypothetical protein
MGPRDVPSDQEIGPLAGEEEGTVHFQTEIDRMFNLLGSVTLVYLAGTGLVTTASTMGRGLVRAARRAVTGDLRDAGVEVLAALAVPAVLSCTAVSALITEVVHGASELAGDTLEGATVPLPSRDAA